MALRLGLGLGLSRRDGPPAAPPGGGEVPVDEPSGSDGEASGLDTGTIIFDGGFSGTPVFTNNGNGKKAAGTSTDFAKFLFSIGTPEAGAIYTMTYDPDFSGLSQTGKLAMVGFGFKQGNKYHFAGLRGDGDTGLNAYKVHGNNFNTLKATTEVDGGAAADGTQAGPNWLQVEIAGDGSTYTLRTSSDGTTWADEFTGSVPTPIGGATDATDFGIAIYLDAADKGPFEVDVTLWQKVVLTAPAQFGTGDWSVADAATGGAITITVTALPDDGGSAITDLEYQIDGGSWVSLGGTTTGDYPVAGLTDDVEVAVAIRAVNAVGNGTASATKAVTSTAAVPTLTFRESRNDETDLSTYTFSGVDIGPVHADRTVLVEVIWRSGSGANTSDVSSLTVGGIAAKAIGGTRTSLAGVRFLIASVPTGTTATIAVGFAATQDQCRISVYTSEAVDLGMVHADSYTGTSNQTFTGFMVENGGALLVGGNSTAGAAPTATITYAGVDSLTEDVSATSGIYRHISASTDLTETAQNDLAVEFSGTGSKVAAAITLAEGHPPLNLALVALDTAHAASTNTRTALLAFGHTVTLVAEANLGTTDFSSYAALVVARASNNSTVAGQLRTLLDGGKPIILGSTPSAGGSGETKNATTMNLTGTWRSESSAAGHTELVITENAHALTAIFVEATIAVYTAANFRSQVQAGQSHVGTALATNDPNSANAGEVALIAIEAGTTDLAAGTTGARCVVGDLPYGGNSAYTNLGATLLNRAVQWAAGNIG